MKRLEFPSTALLSVLAAATTFVTMLSWSGFSEWPSGYMIPILDVCMLVALSGMLLRAAHLPALVVVAGQVVVVVLFFNHEWAGAQALGGWLPTGDSLAAVQKAISDSATAAQSYAAPVPRTVPQFDPLMELAGGSAALLVDFLACGLRRAPLAGLPLLAVYTAPVSVLDGGVSWLKFALAAGCFLALIAAEEGGRLAHWGHQVGSGRLFDTQATTVSSQAVWSSARKIGATATGLAVIAPFFVPTLSGSLLNGHGHGPGGHGAGVDLSNPMVDMKRNLTQGANIPLLRVRTDAAPSYFQIAVLDQFNGQQWRASGRDIPVDQRAEGLVTRPPGLTQSVASTLNKYTMAASGDFRSKWLPTPYPVRTIHAPGDWRYDQSTLDFISAADGQTTANLDYGVEALDLHFTAKELQNAGPAPASVFAPDTALPKDLPSMVGTLAQQVTAKAATKFDAAVMLQDWFRTGGGFRYSLAVAPGDGSNDLVRFLGTGAGSRTGYCQQFASAMAVMGRSVGIPARVVVGFLRSHPLGNNDYVFNSHDMHAWPELYFGGYGWVRFEPTPGVRAASVPAYTLAAGTGGGPSQPASSAAALPTLNRFSDSPSAGGVKNPSAAAGGSAGAGIPPWVSVVGVLLMVALLAMAVPLVGRTVRRRRRWAAQLSPADLLEAGWSEVRDTALDLGVPWDDHVTLRHRARDLLRSFGAADAVPDALGRAGARGAMANPVATQALDRLVRLLERARYARALPRAEVLTDEVHRDVALVVEALGWGASRRARLRARWLPLSLWAKVRGRDARARRTRLVVRETGVDHAI
jgi:transglutaminase-like putative cysteine protease